MQLITNDSIWRKIEGGKFTEHTVHYPEQYHKIFTQLEWWEDRDESEMPKYLKSSIDNEVIKVTRYSVSSYPLDAITHPTQSNNTLNKE